MKQFGRQSKSKRQSSPWFKFDRWKIILYELNIINFISLLDTSFAFSFLHFSTRFFCHPNLIWDYSSHRTLSAIYSMIADLSKAGEEWYCWMLIRHQMWLNSIKFEANFPHCIYSLSPEGMVENWFKVGIEDSNHMNSKGIRNHDTWGNICVSTQA